MRSFSSLPIAVILALSAVACAHSTVTVPNLSGAGLLQEVREDLKPSYVDRNYPGFAGSSLVRDERGRTYEVATWKPNRDVVTEEVRAHFAKLGFRGNAAAFLEWARQDTGDGWFATVPDEPYCVSAVDDSEEVAVSCFAPYFRRLAGSTALLLRYVDRAWPADTTFVAFREVRRK